MAEKDNVSFKPKIMTQINLELLPEVLVLPHHF